MSDRFLQLFVRLNYRPKKTMTIIECSFHRWLKRQILFSQFYSANPKVELDKNSKKICLNCRKHFLFTSFLDRANFFWSFSFSRPDYRQSIFDHLKSIEQLYAPSLFFLLSQNEKRNRKQFDFVSEKNFLDLQSDVNSAMRTILIDWLIEVADEYKLHDETLFLCTQYIDRFLSSINITRSRLQLLGSLKTKPPHSNMNSYCLRGSVRSHERKFIFMSFIHTAQGLKTVANPRKFSERQEQMTM